MHKHNKDKTGNFNKEVETIENSQVEIPDNKQCNKIANSVDQCGNILDIAKERISELKY
jgi:hypothetical protein